MSYACTCFSYDHVDTDNGKISSSAVLKRTWHQRPHHVCVVCKWQKNATLQEAPPHTEATYHEATPQNNDTYKCNRYYYTFILIQSCNSCSNMDCATGLWITISWEVLWQTHEGIIVSTLQGPTLGHCHMSWNSFTSKTGWPSSEKTFLSTYPLLVSCDADRGDKFPPGTGRRIDLRSWS